MSGTTTILTDTTVSNSPVTTPSEPTPSNPTNTSTSGSSSSSSSSSTGTTTTDVQPQPTSSNQPTESGSSSTRQGRNKRPQNQNPAPGGVVTTVFVTNQPASGTQPTQSIGEIGLNTDTFTSPTATFTLSPGADGKSSSSSSVGVDPSVGRTVGIAVGAIAAVCIGVFFGWKLRQRGRRERAAADEIHIADPTWDSQHGSRGSWQPSRSSVMGSPAAALPFRPRPMSYQVQTEQHAAPFTTRPMSYQGDPAASYGAEAGYQYGAVPMNGGYGVVPPPLVPVQDQNMLVVPATEMSYQQYQEGVPAVTVSQYPAEHYPASTEMQQSFPPTTYVEVGPTYGDPCYVVSPPVDTSSHQFYGAAPVEVPAGYSANDVVPVAAAAAPIANRDMPMVAVTAPSTNDTVSYRRVQVLVVTLSNQSKQPGFKILFEEIVSRVRTEFKANHEIKMVEVPFGFDPTSYSHIEGALKIVQAVVFLVKITKWMEPAEVDVVNSFKSVIERSPNPIPLVTVVTQAIEVVPEDHMLDQAHVIHCNHDLSYIEDYFNQLSIANAVHQLKNGLGH